jgi:hypothetical protein
VISIDSPAATSSRYLLACCRSSRTPIVRMCYVVAHALWPASTALRHTRWPTGHDAVGKVCVGADLIHEAFCLVDVDIRREPYTVEIQEGPRCRPKPLPNVDIGPTAAEFDKILMAPGSLR